MWSVLKRLVDIGVAETTLEGTIRECNTTYASMFGRDVTEVVGMSVVDLTAEEDRARTVMNYTLLRTGASHEIRQLKKYQHIHGMAISKRMHSVLVRSESGEPRCVMTFVYEYETNDSDVRAQQLEQMLLKVLALLSKHEPGVRIEMKQEYDSSRHVTADHGSTAHMGNTSSQMSTGGSVWVVAVLFVGFVAAALAVMMLMR